MNIVKPLEILALSSDEQIKYLKKIGTYPSTDELALQFEDAYVKLVGDYNEGIASSTKNQKLLEDMKNINEILNYMSDSKLLRSWNVESLNEEHWNQVRLLASNILKKYEI